MKKNKIYDVAVLGGGASGLLCAVRIKSLHKNLSVCIIDKNPRLGKKLLLTGNGKCNLSNLNVGVENYTTNDRNFLGTVLSKKTAKDIIKYFESTGLLCKSDSMGRVYPYSEQSSSVLNLFRLELERLKIDVITDFNVIDIEKQREYFSIKSQSDNVCAKKLVLACGGKACPKTGSDGALLNIFSKLGLQTVKPYPVLVPIKISEQSMLSSLQGVRAKAKINLFCDNVKLGEEIGEVQFRKDAVSGICIFNISKYISKYDIANTIIRKKCRKNFKLICDFFCDVSYEKLLNIVKRKLKLYKEKSLSEILSVVVNKKLASAVIKNCGLKGSIIAGDLTFSELQKIVYSLKSFCLTPVDTLSFEDAQASAGGLSCSEFNANNMMSKRIENLYAIGEVLDVVGDCGGYNLHFAWITALICAENIKNKTRL